MGEAQAAGGLEKEGQAEEHQAIERLISESEDGLY